MVDLHCHILPAVDDGAADLDASMAMARTAVHDGIKIIVATPHVNFDYEVDPYDIGRQVGELNIALSGSGLPLAVLSGAEISLAKLATLDTDVLRLLTLGPSPFLLVESPYSTTAPFLPELLFGLEQRGFRTILAHPERSPMFQQDPALLAGLVEKRVACCVSAGSLAGDFGSKVKSFTVRLFRERLAHVVSSDAHNNESRRPELTEAFERAEDDLPGILELREWFTEEAPNAILAGEYPPAAPPVAAHRRSRLRRMLGRSR